MVRKGAAHITAVLTIGVLLAGPAVAAPRGAAGREEGPSLSRFWEAAVSWFAEVLPGQWMAEAACDHGSYIDPDGYCLSGSAAGSDSDHGGFIDPNG